MHILKLLLFIMCWMPVGHSFHSRDCSGLKCFLQARFSQTLILQKQDISERLPFLPLACFSTPGPDENAGQDAGRSGQQLFRAQMEAEASVRKFKTYLYTLLVLLLIAAILLYFEFRSRARAARNLQNLSAQLARQKDHLSSTIERLMLSESRYRNLVENSPTGILLLDRHGNILEVNRRMLEILGSPGPQQTKQINCLEYQPLRETGLSDDLRQCISTGKSFSRIIHYTSKWGKELHLNYTITPLKNSRDEVTELILNAEDITAFVLAERSRLESEHKYRILVEHSLQAALIVQAGKVIFTNSKIRELTGYGPEEIVAKGRRWLNLLMHPDDKRRSYINMRDALDGKGVDARQVYKIIRSDGPTRIMETLSAVIEYQGKPAMLIVAIDITDRTEDRNKLVRSEKRLTELNAMKDKFFSIIAHDLKNPFSSILGFSNLLNDAYDNFDDKQRKAFIKTICEASESTFKLLQNLLEWSRTQTGKIEFLPRQLELAALVEDNVVILSSAFSRKKIEMSVNIPEKTGIYADENMAKLVIRNLLSNAAKFTPKNGKVEVSAKGDQNETILTIRDSGVGMTKEDLVRLFRIDDQIKTKGTDGEDGSGLGLILCKEFAERNKGRIWVNSRVGDGSSFHVSFPARNKEDSYITGS